MNKHRAGMAGLAALAVAAAMAQAQAQDIASFYKGKQVSIIVGSSPGGGYDLYGRLLARHMGKHLPGNPVFVVSNMPGAGGNVAAAHIANVAPKDGTVIGAIFMGTVVEPLFTITQRSSTTSAARTPIITSVSCAATRR
jgi:tripartite-type tricarboxylate transporter receptor subunit TctC